MSQKLNDKLVVLVIGGLIVIWTIFLIYVAFCPVKGDFLYPVKILWWVIVGLGFTLGISMSVYQWFVDEVLGRKDEYLK